MSNLDWLERKKEIYNQTKIYNGKPLFNLIELNISNICNRSCSFCPLESPTTSQFMSFEMFDSILDDLVKVDYDGIIAFSGFCEPTLHPNLILFADLARKRLPNSLITMSTNGLRLNLYFDSFDFITVSCYDIETFNKAEQLGDKFLPVIRYNTLDFRNNRAGALPTNVDLPINSPCYYPFYTMVIDYIGDVVYCPNNYDKHNIAGNVKNESLLDIWLNDNMEDIRSRLKNSKRDIEPCSLCDVDGLCMGEKNYEIW